MTDDEAPTFGKVLRHFRKEAGLSQEAVAQQLRDQMTGSTWTQQTIANWEKGPQVPDDRVVRNLSDIVEDDYGELMVFVAPPAQIADVMRRIEALEDEVAQMKQLLPVDAEFAVAAQQGEEGPTGEQRRPAPEPNE